MRDAKNFLIFLFTIVGILVIATAVFLKDEGKQKAELDKNSVAVYFLRAYGPERIGLSGVRRNIKNKPSEQSRLEFALTELIIGPTLNESANGYFTEIPEETEIIEVKETAERVTINLSTGFEAGGGSDSMTSRLKQLVFTALDSVEKKPVYLEIEGEKVEFLGGEGVMVPQPLSRNLDKGQEI